MNVTSYLDRCAGAQAEGLLAILPSRAGTLSRGAGVDGEWWQRHTT